MKEKYKNNYKIDSMRNQKWDYSWNGAYFITIVTKKRHPYFGEIQNNKMILNEIGKLARNHWLQIPKHFPFIKLDRYVIMPDHFHGLLWIEKDKACLVSTNDQNLRDDKDKACLVSTNDQNLCNDKDKACLVSTNDQNPCNDKDKACLVSMNDQNLRDDKDKACLVSSGHDQMNRFRNPGKFSISTVIGSFKSSVTKTAKRVNHQFGWQSGFHDRIIRNEIILNKVRNYIIENPARWESNEDIL
jgi:putative transposase